MKNLRCDDVIVQLVLREYDDAGLPVAEGTTNTVKLFRGSHKDLWAYVDEQVAAVNAKK